MEEKYKLTKEEKKIIKKMGLLIKKSKELKKNQEPPKYYSAQSDKYNKNDMALRRMFEKYSRSWKLEEDPIKSHIRTYYEIGKSLKEDLELCKRLQDQDILSVISKEPWKLKEKGIEEKLRLYYEKRLKPAVEKYTIFLEEATKLYETYAKQFFNSIRYDHKKFLTYCETKLIRDKVIDETLVIDRLIKGSNKDLTSLYEHIQPEFEIIFDLNGNIHPPRKCEKIPLLKKEIVDCSEKEADKLFEACKTKILL